MLYFDRTGTSEGIDISKPNVSKECDICHYLYFLDRGFMFQLHVCNKCHDVLMMSMNPGNITILDINGADYRCISNRISKNKEVNLLQKADLKETREAVELLVSVNNLWHQKNMAQYFLTVTKFIENY